MEKYITIDNYILSQDELSRQLIFLLRDIILSTTPEITERLSFNCPFYHYKGMLCYISIEKKTVYIGFCRGVLLKEKYPILEIKNRKLIASISYKNMEEVDVDLIQNILQDSMKLNEKKVRFLK
ncbi:MAG: DUF1801 domain-containing protein [Saprospirales bacterium]|nr:DUF1801 domain-containing protein [Saprospirales bacterium]